jgi:hypothetical protein
MKPKCKCGHAEEEHAPDRNHPDVSPCWHGACTGDGCTEKYDDKCKNYEEKT